MPGLVTSDMPRICELRRCQCIKCSYDGACECFCEIAAILVEVTNATCRAYLRKRALLTAYMSRTGAKVTKFCTRDDLETL